MSETHLTSLQKLVQEHPVQDLLLRINQGGQTSHYSLLCQTEQNEQQTWHICSHDLILDCWLSFKPQLSYPIPPPLNPTTSLTSPHSTCPQHDQSGSPKLFSPIPTNSITKDKWPSPPPSLNDPYTLGEGIGYVNKWELRCAYSSVGAPSLDTSTAG